MLVSTMGLSYKTILVLSIIIQNIKCGLIDQGSLRPPTSVVEDNPVIQQQPIPLLASDPSSSHVALLNSQKHEILSKNNDNIFINPQFPLRVSLQSFSQLHPQAPNFAGNPFLTGAVLPHPVTKPPTTTSIPSYENNPFLNAHTSHQSNIVHLPTSAIPITTINTNNPFLYPETTNPTLYPTTTEATQSTFKPNPANPFFNPQSSVSTSLPSIQPDPVTTPFINSLPNVQPSSNSPLDQSRLPVHVEIEKSHQLRSFCAKSRGQFPSGRCNTFVNCWDHVVVEQTCPTGLVFNFAGYCDYPQNVDCHGRIFEEVLVPQAPETVSLVISEQPQKIQGQQSNHNQDESNASKPCNQSVVAEKVEVNLTPPIEYVPTPVDARLKAKCLQPRGQFPSDACNKYVECWDNSVAELECPKGLYFSEKGYCDYVYNVNCHSRTIVKAESNSACPRPDGTFRDAKNCGNYFVCISNVVAGMNECPAGLYFNDIIGVCDYSHNVDCNREPFVYQPPQIADTIQKIPIGILNAVKECQPGKVFSLNNDCSSAVLCRKGETEVVYCPTGLAYDAPSDRCLPLQLAKCEIA
ncbi:hypothetical protein RI129_001551 [Pyrocoelia pectoralis]|uniref:Chitin-binding type-2 domain-containing protein n=1 Tax=Pyrocoelia pectoralis TaxID=417401 RepID=A0AAN7ZTH9_9COLE